MIGEPAGVVVAVHRSAEHVFSKQSQSSVRLIEGLGVDGDAHSGVTVQHLSRVARDPDAPNLRQVHLIQVELLGELERSGFRVEPGDLGENVTTSGLDLLALPTDAVLRLGPAAAIRITGLRNPCAQLDRFSPGLTAAVLDRAPDGELIRKAGVMAVVLRAGVVAAGDPVWVELPSGRHEPLRPV